MDHLGNPVYEKAKGGELKRDLNGNPVLKADAGKTKKYLHLRLCPIISGQPLI